MKRVSPKDDEHCQHGRNRKLQWCEPCFRKEQRERWGRSNYDYCDLFGREHG